MSTFFLVQVQSHWLTPEGKNDWKELNSKKPLGTQELLTSKSQLCV